MVGDVGRAQLWLPMHPLMAACLCALAEWFPMSLVRQSVPALRSRHINNRVHERDRPSEAEDSAVDRRNRSDSGGGYRDC
jgi:hypothetical protein